ncbi:pilus assembly protein TadB [Prosthecochloris sp. GSB1]|uniref:type II secretion system F family protein n=1 Tax=Prosthecochloris sp. GSB1 TaxID=281093 RepID=UPI000B8C9210|nr:type II secretion system F family protein [Prosthecochloris sp. GSB1]ASQ90250.1 pilus assembly protein TadB [Prosthecochloris sp. GSB1]
MTTFFIPFLAFAAVLLVMLLLYWVWAHFFDPDRKAKKQRLQTIHDTVHWGGQRLGIAQTTMQDSELAIWLRSRSRTFERFENLVQRAHSPLTVGRLAGLMIALFTMVLVLGFLRQTNLFLLMVLAVAAAGSPILWLSRRADQRIRAFENKLPETLDFISRALRAGHSLTSALGEVGKEFSAPIGPEFKTVSDEMAFGIPFKDALGQLSRRVQSNDLNFFVTSLLIQHETGGSLAELLDGLAGTIRERFKLRGKVRTLSSEGRASAWILSGMPFVLAGVITLINPGYISLLWTTPQGQKLLVAGFVLMAFGIFMISRIVQIKV